jgi:hypothetical protein
MLSATHWNKTKFKTLKIIEMDLGNDQTTLKPLCQIRHVTLAYAEP